MPGYPPTSLPSFSSAQDQTKAEQLCAWLDEDLRQGCVFDLAALGEVDDDYVAGLLQGTIQSKLEALFAPSNLSIECLQNDDSSSSHSCQAQWVIAPPPTLPVAVSVARLEFHSEIQVIRAVGSPFGGSSSRRTLPVVASSGTEGEDFGVEFYVVPALSPGDQVVVQIYAEVELEDDEFEDFSSIEVFAAFTEPGCTPFCGDVECGVEDLCGGMCGNQPACEVCDLQTLRCSSSVGTTTSLETNTDGTAGIDGTNEDTDPESAFSSDDDDDGYFGAPSLWEIIAIAIGLLTLILVLVVVFALIVRKARA